MHNLNYLPDILILLSASLFIVCVFYKLKLSPVLGYLIIGAVIGEHGLKLVASENTHALGEFGVVFLLFVIGLELTFERLIKASFYVFGFGGLQIVLTTIALVLVMQQCFDLKLSTTIMIAAALSLSSTAIVLQVIAENGRQSTQVGKLSLSVLLMQDFAVIPLLTILPVLASNTDGILHAVSWASVKALFTIAIITIGGRLVLRPFFSLISSVKQDEIYVTTALLIVLGSAWMTHSMGLSTAMGAFIAGLLIAETEYRNRIEDSIMPFQGLFMALFFLTVGMSINIEFINANFKNVLIAAAGLILIKSLIITVLSKLFKFKLGASIHSGLLLSQGGEFAFILFNLAASQKVISSDTSQFLLMVVTVTMAVTPLLSIIGTYFEDKLDLAKDLDVPQQYSKEISDLHNHVIISGFGRVGRVVAYMLVQEGIDYVAVDTNIILVKKAREQGLPIYHGDLSHVETLKGVGASKAAAILLCMSDRTSLRKSAKNIVQHYKNLLVISRVEDLRHDKWLKKLGRIIAVPTIIEAGLQLGGTLLKNLNVADHEIINLKEKFRRNNYSVTEEVELFKAIVPQHNKSVAANDMTDKKTDEKFNKKNSDLTTGA